VKTLKITIISVMMLMLLFLPAMQVKMPVAEACVPSEPVEVQEITGLEKQQIINIILDSFKFSIAVEWLKTKNIETDTRFEAIQVLKINSSRFSGYIAKIPQKIDTIPRDISEIRVGGIFVVLDESEEILSIEASYLKPTVNSRSLIIETLTFNSEESYIAYMLMTRGRIYRIKEPYETSNIKMAVLQSPEIETKVDWECFMICAEWQCLWNPVSLTWCAWCVAQCFLGSPSCVFCTAEIISQIIIVCCIQCGC